MKLNAFRKGAFEPQIPPLPIALHWLLHIYIICLVLQSWVCDHLKGRRYATIGPWIVSWITSLLQRQRLESNRHQISWKWGLLGTTLFFFLFRVRNTFIEGRKQVSSFYEREVQDYTGGIGIQAASVGLFAHCLFPLPSQFWAEVELRHERGRGRKNTETLRDSFQAGVSWTWASARGWRGMGWHPDGQTDCSNSPFYGLIGR